MTLRIAEGGEEMNREVGGNVRKRRNKNNFFKIYIMVLGPTFP